MEEKTQTPEQMIEEGRRRQCEKWEAKCKEVKDLRARLGKAISERDALDKDVKANAPRTRRAKKAETEGPGADAEARA